MATKDKSKGQTKRKFPKAGTIGNMVLTALSKNSDVTTESLKTRILKKFPDSKFNAAHLAWYKHQVRVGNYTLPKVERKEPKKSHSPSAAQEQEDNATDEAQAKEEVQVA